MTKRDRKAELEALISRVRELNGPDREVEKLCLHCGTRMVKHKAVSRRRWATHRFCSPGCASKTLNKPVGKEEMKERILSRIQIDPETGCWNYTMGKSRDGYSIIVWKRKTLKGYRLAYELWIGEIPQGMCVCHRCDNRACVNPDHLFLGTSAENTKDRDAKGRAARGERAGRAKLTEKQVIEIRASGCKNYAEIARTYGVGETAARKVVLRESWAHI